MWRRLRDPDKATFYKNRGIAICERWQEFAAFVADMGERPIGTTLERKDNDGNYEPGNCVWATRAEQANNTRTTANCRRIDCYSGPRGSKTVKEWSRVSGTPIGTIKSRLRAGVKGKAAIYGYAA